MMVLVCACAHDGRSFRPEPPDAAKATLYVFREERLSGSARSPDLLINGAKAFEIHDGGHARVLLDPGRYLISVDSATFQNGDRVVRLEGGRVYYLRYALEPSSDQESFLVELDARAALPRISRTRLIDVDPALHAAPLRQAELQRLLGDRSPAPRRRPRLDTFLEWTSLWPIGADPHAGLELDRAGGLFLGVTAGESEGPWAAVARVGGVQFPTGDNDGGRLGAAPTVLVGARFTPVRVGRLELFLDAEAGFTKWRFSSDTVGPLYSDVHLAALGVAGSRLELLRGVGLAASFAYFVPNLAGKDDGERTVQALGLTAGLDVRW